VSTQPTLLAIDDEPDVLATLGRGEIRR